MASQIIGRAACPECDFAGAHVKQSEKCVYRYCPECGSQTIAKTERQQTNMKKHMRPVPTDDPTSASGVPVVAVVPVVVKAEPPPRRRIGLFG